MRMSGRVYRTVVLLVVLAGVSVAILFAQQAGAGAGGARAAGAEPTEGTGAVSGVVRKKPSAERGPKASMAMRLSGTARVMNSSARGSWPRVGSRLDHFPSSSLSKSLGGVRRSQLYAVGTKKSV